MKPAMIKSGLALVRVKPVLPLETGCRLAQPVISTAAVG